MLSDKESATSIVINGEFTDSDWVSLKNIRNQLPRVENIILSDVKKVEFGVFVYKDGILHVSNKWLRSISAPQVETIGASAFWCCEELETANFPNLIKAGEEAFCASEKLSSLDFPKLVDIGDGCFSGCKGLVSLNLGASDKILTTDRSFYLLNTADIDLSLNGYEASQAIGKIWKDQNWKSISSMGKELPAADFGVANWGCFMEFIENHETGTPISGGSSSKRIYADNNGNWKSYFFENNKGLIKGENDYSTQFSGEYSDLIFLPITSYKSTLDKLKLEYGTPYSESEDVFAFNMSDKNASTPGYAFAEGQWVMNGSKTFLYKFKNNRTNVECKLSSYLRTGKYQTWGFTITTTYTPVNE